MKPRRAKAPNCAPSTFRCLFVDVDLRQMSFHLSFFHGVRPMSVVVSRSGAEACQGHPCACAQSRRRSRRRNALVTTNQLRPSSKTTSGSHLLMSGESPAGTLRTRAGDVTDARLRRAHFGDEAQFKPCFVAGSVVIAAGAIIAFGYEDIPHELIIFFFGNESSPVADKGQCGNTRVLRFLFLCLRPFLRGHAWWCYRVFGAPANLM